MKLVEKQKFFGAIIFYRVVGGVLYTNLVAIDYFLYSYLFDCGHLWISIP